MKHLPSPVSFREDINGLRAYAVIAVLLFHFSLIGLPGGFAGVDVFFVISGYLMTAIIVNGREKGSFSIVKFYMARARRILPALMVLIIFLLVLGWFWLPTTDYKALGSQSVFSLTFMSNIYYFLSAGYFDVASHEKWLLHTWSLAVEAQFYVLYPLFVAIIWRLWPGLKALILSLLVIFVVSLVANIMATIWYPSAAFYLLPTRGWELAAGGLVYLVARQGWVMPKFKSIGYWLGWVLMLGSFLLIHETFAWPGWWAILPVFGASLIILGQREDCKLINNSVAQWLGDRSYSLYLWHWPLVVALYFAGLESHWIWVSGAFALSLLLANLSYNLVEVPTRQYLSQAKLFNEIFAIGVAGALIGFAAISVKLFTFEGRVQEALEVASNESKNLDPRYDICFKRSNENGSPRCTYGINQVSGFVMGDSHSASLITAIGESAKKLDRSVIFWGMISCPTIKDFKYNNDHFSTGQQVEACKNFNEAGFNYLTNLSVPVILISRTSSYLLGPNEAERVIERQFASYYFDKKVSDINDSGLQKKFLDGIKNTACELQKNHQVFLVRPIPEMNVNVPNAIGRNIMFGRGAESIKITLSEYHARNNLVWKAQDETAQECGVKILDPLPYLCDEKYCYGSRNGRSLYYDEDHLSEFGNKFLVPMFDEVFKASQPD